MPTFRLAILIMSLALGIASVRAQAALPRIEPADCAFNATGYRGYTEATEGIDCGYLIVPEDRGQPEGTRLRLHYAVVRASGGTAAQPDPVVYLNGGPGGDSLSQMPDIYYALGAYLGENRDFVFFDQRGTGYSRPSLVCSEFDAMQYDLLDEDLRTPEARDLLTGALQACANRIASRGVNVAAYNSAENAADLDDLRRLLGYDQWNLYGISYGTRLALTAMRDQPDGIRSVVLDSVLPPQVSYYSDQPANLERALTAFFLACTRSAACNARYPRLGTVFYDTVAQLNASRGQARIIHPTTYAEYTVLVDGNLLIGLAFSSLYQPELTRLLPKLIDDVRAGNYRLLAATLEMVLAQQEGFSMGMHMAVMCNEEMPFIAPDGLRRSLASIPSLESFFHATPNLGTMALQVCGSWSSYMPPPLENAPVVSDIPALVVAGEFDPITPPHWARLAAATLPNSYTYTFQGMGHGASVGADCPMRITAAFINDPATGPDTSCMAQMAAPDFLIDDRSITLIPFTDAAAGVRSVRPQEWVEWMPGLYSRSEADENALRFLRLEDVPADYLIRYLAAEFDIYDRPRTLEQRAANGLSWAVYEFRRGDQYFHSAVAETARTTYWVLLTSTFYEKDALYTDVLIPAIDSFQPV
jgi:pimeloyl-ACP methyl ester carboxylesterase